MRTTLLMAVSALLLTSCTQDTYEKGDGEYSALQADFVEAHTNADKKVDYVVTDEGQRLNLASLYEADWLLKQDTLYRAALYYEKDGEDADVVSMSRIPVPTITPKDSVKKGMKMDPITLESMWVSKSKRYLNAGFYLKSGSTDNEDAVHRLAVISDTLMKNADNTHTLYLRLYHDQGGMPEYYSVHSYFSLPLQGLTADSIRLTVNTYKGEVVKTLYIK